MKRRPKGSGTIRRAGRGFAIVHGARGAEQYEGGFRTKAEAERRLTLLRAEAMQRRLGVAADPRRVPTLGELAGPWLARRKETNAAGAEDGSRWRKHLAPAFGHLRPDQVDQARIRAFVEGRKGVISPGTIRVVVAVLSSLYEDLLERQLAPFNPCRRLPKSILRQMRSTHDPRTTPFVEKLADVRRIFLALEEPLNVAYAIGALGGLRTGEVFALRWTSVDLAGRRILVSESVGGQTKDREPRPVPIQDALLPVLKAWHVRSGGTGLVIPPLRSDGKNVDKSTPAQHLRRVLVDLELSPLEPKPWYQATRHTFASHWAMAGRPLRELQAILGHASITDTERYAHLTPGFWADGVHGAIEVDLSASDAPVAQLPGAAAAAEHSEGIAKSGRRRIRKHL
jgi:integrase